MELFKLIDSIYISNNNNLIIGKNDNKIINSENSISEELNIVKVEVVFPSE